MKWTGYEELIDNDPQFQNMLAYYKMNEEEKFEFRSELLRKIREINIFPIYYYDNEGVLDEIKKVMNKEVTIKDLGGKAAQGTNLLDFLFFNLHKARAAGSYDCMFDRFYDDKKMHKILDYQMKHWPITNMRSAFMIPARYLWSTATNFLPIKAKIIAEAFCPKNGVIYDYSAGYGGRMLGILSSNMNFKYIGCEPNKETCLNLERLGTYISQLKLVDYEIINGCSEEVELENESVDFCFSCPPYYKIEHYSDDENQCTNRYKTYKNWLEFYVKPTIINCYNALKNNCYYAVVIANCMWGGQVYKVKDDWLKICEEIGFTPYCSYNLSNSKRKDYVEKVYIFKKGGTL